MKRAIKKMCIFFYNYKNKTKIKSTEASLHAKYSKKVLIDTDTIVERNVTIGKYSYVNKKSSIENCDIGAFCSISSGVYINPYEHELSKVTSHPIGQDKMYNANSRVTIGNDVLISLNCIILEGVTIGDGAVVAAGAVVTHDVLPYEIVGGVPARHIGFRTDEKTILRMLEIKWWTWDDKKIKNNLNELKKNIDEFANNC